MPDRKLLHEAGTLSKPAAGASTYPCRIISEGKGSSGTYRRELLAEYKDAFEGALSFMNHPLDPAKPHLRDVTGIAGRLVGPIEAKEVDGVFGLYSEYRPDPRWAGFVEEYADALGLSIYIAGIGREEGDEYIVESFDGSDPYRSVDIVVAAGRGGRFERARESLRAIESSLGSPSDPNPPAASAEETNRKEHNMEKWEEAVTGINSKLDAFIAKSEAALTAAEAAKTKAEADAQAAIDSVEDKVKEALEAYKSKADAIDAAELLEPQKESLLKLAASGGDITEPLAEAVKVVAAAKTLAESGGSFIRTGESSGDYTIGAWN